MKKSEIIKEIEALETVGYHCLDYHRLIAKNKRPTKRQLLEVLKIEKKAFEIWYTNFYNPFNLF